MTNIFTLTRVVILILFLSLLGSCAKKLTKEDVQKQIEKARKASNEAHEEAREAIDMREKFYTDYKETRTKELTNRADNIESRIKELKRTSGKSENEEAAGNINSAIGSLESEKREVNGQLERVKNIKAESWAASFDSVNTAIRKIEAELNKLSKSLEE